MTQLINKGGFRERANRTRKYKQSENELTTLVPNQYRAGLKETDQHTLSLIHISEPTRPY